jgi:hypothetical protein
VSDDNAEVKVVAAPGPSRKAHKGKKGKQDPTEGIDEEMLRLIEMENGFRNLGADLLRKANDLREWREEKYGPV